MGSAISSLLQTLRTKPKLEHIQIFMLFFASPQTFNILEAGLMIYNFVAVSNCQEMNLETEKKNPFLQENTKALKYLKLALQAV